MKNPTVQSLRQNGVRVKVSHSRYLRDGTLKRRLDIEDGNEIDARGGLVTVELTKDGNTYKGVSNCSKRDNFRRHYGLNSALGRAYGAMTKGV